MLDFQGGIALCYRNDFCGTRHRLEWMLTARFYGTFGGSVPVGWPQINLEMHLHLNSKFVSNEFRTEFALKDTIGV